MIILKWESQRGRRRRIKRKRRKRKKRKLQLLQPSLPLQLLASECLSQNSDLALMISIWSH